MDSDEDDLYGTDAPSQELHTAHNASSTQPPLKTEGDGDVAMDEDEDDSDDDSDSDVDIITESKPPPKQETAPPARPESAKVKIEAPPARTASAQPDVSTSRGTIQGPPSGKNYPEVRSKTKVEVDGTPTYEPLGKPVTDVLIDADSAWDEKPWRHPGADLKDYFNYGFDEFSWQMYCERQKSMREMKSNIDQENSNMMAMFGGGMPGMPGAPGGGMDMQSMMSNPMMQQAFSQMMQQSGGDPNNIDESTFMNTMSTMGNAYQAGQGMGMDGMQQQQQPPQHAHRGGYGGRRGRRGGW